MEHTKHATATALRLLFSILLLDVIGLSMLYPIAAYLVRPYSRDALMVTLMTVIYAGAQFLTSPVLGKLGDRYGRRPVLLVSIFGSAVGYLVLGIGGALWVLFLSRLIGGIAASNQSTVAAAIADLSTPDTRAKNFTLIGLAWGIGLIVGPAVGAALAQVDLAAPAYLAMLLSILSGLLTIVFLPESLPEGQRSANSLQFGDLNPLVSIRAIARLPGLGGLLLILCIFNFVFNGINSIETLFLIERFAARPEHVGGLLVVAGMTIALVQRFVQRLVSHYGEQGIAVVALIGLALAVLATPFLPYLWLIFPLTMIRTAASSCVFPTLGALMSSRVSPQEQGTLMGVTTAMSSLMGVLGPLWAGALYDRLAPGAPYGVGTCLFLFAAVLLLFLRSQGKREGLPLTDILYLRRQKPPIDCNDLAGNK